MKVGEVCYNKVQLGRVTVKIILLRDYLKCVIGIFYQQVPMIQLQRFIDSTSISVSFSVPPTIHVQPQDTNVTNGYSLTLNCQATGFPQPVVSWQKDGQAVDTSHVTLLSNGSLYIFSTVMQDAGRFSCKASNSAGSATVSADVVIYGKCSR